MDYVGCTSNESGGPDAQSCTYDPAFPSDCYYLSSGIGPEGWTVVVECDPVPPDCGDEVVVGGAAWTCESRYDLPSYDGDQTGLCPASESVFLLCCPDDIGASINTACAPNNSVCIAGSYCTTYNTDPECGWTHCTQRDDAAGGTSDGSDKCPPELVAQPEHLIACASDVHCEGTHQVCNQRIANRMFCGEPNSTGQGGTSG